MSRALKSRIDQLTKVERQALGQIGRTRRSRFDHKFSLSLLRMREIEALIRHRHGQMIPDPTGTDDVDACMAYVTAAAGSQSDQDMRDWCAYWAPWISPSDLDAIVIRSSTRKRMIPADDVARLLGVTFELRSLLTFKTIGACDVSKAERQRLAKDRKRERDRLRAATKRSQNVRMDRASYEANSAERLRPWEAEGISRRTWYRCRGTSASQIVLNMKGDTPVPNVDGFPPTPPHSEHDGAMREACGARGSGSVTPAGLQGAEPHGTGDCEEAA
ncbi:MAG: hypothetical protein CML29_05030 [Rhizobiales bacterium]|nr:hypothetical protein [Hyphomicrobiales bacterium]MBA71018.1 hypothetical protein [Hyphomicrobiales bacterium]|tara:strand:+ start:4404 stop:5225 length:822 start_codon:yes stop_codon:yes gene_type:complete